MIRKYSLVILSMALINAIFVLVAARAAEPQPVQSSVGTCDRTCLARFVTRYLEALIAHKPGNLPLAPDTRFTEDCKEMKLGEGFWKTASRLADYRWDILDARQGVAFSFLVVEENSSPVLFVLRLKIAGQQNCRN